MKSSVEIFNAVAAGMLTPEEGAKLLRRQDHAARQRLLAYIRGAILIMFVPALIMCGDRKLAALQMAVGIFIIWSANHWRENE